MVSVAIVVAMLLAQELLKSALYFLLLSLLVVAARGRDALAPRRASARDIRERRAAVRANLPLNRWCRCSACCSGKRRCRRNTGCLVRRIRRHRWRRIYRKRRNCRGDVTRAGVAEERLVLLPVVAARRRSGRVGRGGCTG